MPAYSDEVLQEILQRTDMVQLIGEQVLLRRRGRSYVGLCPFHQEKTPSFSVDPDRGLFYCFGCQTGGTAFTFIQKTEGISFPEAVELLAERSGVTLPTRDTDYDDSQLRLKRRLYDACEAALLYFREQFKSHAEAGKARRYTIQRGLEPDTIELFQLGYAPPEWRGIAEYLQINGFGLDILQAAGLVVQQSEQTYYDRFRDRLIFPIFDHRGRCIAFGGRQLDPEPDQPKYLNSPQTLIFDKSNTLYGLHLLRKEKPEQLVLYEGYMDLIAAWQAGSPHGVASLGTALTPEHCRLLRRFCHKVVLCYDADPAGQAAASRGMFMLQRAGLEVTIAQIPAGKDPDEFIRQYGGEAYRQQVLENALPLLRFCKDKLKTEFSMDTIEGKSSYSREFLTILAKVASPVEQEEYLLELAKELNLTPESLRRERERISDRSRGRTSLAEAATSGNAPMSPSAGSSPQSRGIQGGTGRHFVEQEASVKPSKGESEATIGRARAEEHLLALALRDPFFGNRLREQFSSDQFLEKHRPLVEALLSVANQRETERTSIALDPELANLVARLSHIEETIGSHREQAFAECATFLKRKLLEEEAMNLQQLCDSLQREGDDVALGEAVGRMQEIQRLLAKVRDQALILE